MGYRIQISMDISLREEGTRIRITPENIHGMLWLQTHFENKNWVALASNLVTLSSPDAELLRMDALGAGIEIKYVPVVSITEKSEKLH